MDKQKEFNKHHKEKNIHHEKDKMKETLNISDEVLERRMEQEQVSEDRRREERRKILRRDSDRIVEDQKNKALEENERLKAEIVTLKDTMIRRQADFENYKKRALKQHGETRTMTIRDLAHDIILINDDLLRAIEASEKIPKQELTDESYKSFLQGLIMISKRIEETLKKYHVVEIDSLNQQFDPTFHEAVEIEENGNVDHDMVTKVYHKGFRIGDMVVRSSKVKVTKPKSGPDPAASQGSDETEKLGVDTNKPSQ